MSRSNSAGVVCSTVARIPTPALLTRTSRRPQASTAPSIRARTEAASSTSAGMTRAAPPALVTSAATVASRSARRAPRTTRIPARPHATAVAAPIPLEAPVMTTTRPVSSRPFTRATVPGPDFDFPTIRGRPAEMYGSQNLTSTTGGFPMSLAAELAKLSPTSLADALTRDRVMDIGIRPLWPGMPRLAGPAYTVRCLPGDNLMVHAAIYRAAPGDVIVIEAGDVDYAVAGGNVCAVAQRRGVAGFVVDGVIRDVAEARERGFPVLARGVIPIPGGKDKLGALGEPVRVGGVEVHPGDIVVGDEEGVVVVPLARATHVLQAARARAEKDAATSLDAWEKAHRARIDEQLKKLGFQAG